MGLDSIKRRREERLRQLREQMHNRAKQDPFEPGGWEAGEVPSLSGHPAFSSEKGKKERIWEEEQQPHGNDGENSIPSTFIIKVILSLFLLSLTYVIDQLELPHTQQAKAFLAQVMSRDFNFQGAMDRVENMVGDRLAVFPGIVKPNQGDQAVWNDMSQKRTYLAPVKGEVVSSFERNGTGVEFSVTGDREVKAIDQGLVIFAGQKEGLGQTVIIQHQDQVQSWYGKLEKIEVAPNDWVQPGQVVALARERETMYFSVMRDNRYVDPMSVIPVE